MLRAGEEFNRDINILFYRVTHSPASCVRLTYCGAHVQQVACAELVRCVAHPIGIGVHHK